MLAFALTSCYNDFVLKFYLNLSKGYEKVRVFGSILDFLKLTMTTPTSYGWFHLLAFLLVIIGTVFALKKWGNCDDKTFRRLMLIWWITIVVFELYKQLVFSFSHTDGVLTYDYQWYAFPFQFCSTPLYVVPFVAFLPEGKVRDACTFFLGLFSLFGGLAVMFYPGDVFIDIIGINIQTMVHHGSQVIFGIFCALRIYKQKKYDWKRYLGALTVFSVLVGVALLLNVVVHKVLLSLDIQETFNMFFISPYFDCTLPLLSSIYPLVHPVVFIFIYLIGFAIVAGIIYWLVYGVEKMIEYLRLKFTKATPDVQ